MIIQAFVRRFRPPPACRRIALGAALALATAGVAATAGQAAAQGLVPHRALYSLTDTGATASHGATSASGIVRSETLSVCGDWRYNQTLDLVMTLSDGMLRRITTFSETVESQDGLTYTFRHEVWVNGTVAGRIAGQARMAGPGQGGQAIFQSPRRLVVALPAGTLFPLGHAAALLAAVKDGARFDQRSLFTGDAMETPLYFGSAVVGAPVTPGSDQALLAGRAWPISLALFDPDDSGPAPLAEIGGRYFTNGVADHLMLDLGLTVVEGDLLALEALPDEGCAAAGGSRASD